MNFNPMTSNKYIENDSKRTIFSSRPITHEGLMPVSLKMLHRCVEEKKK
jgi:hypothetical protein